MLRLSAKDAVSSRWTIEELDLIRPMTAEQAARLKRLAEAAYDHAAFKPNLTSDEADQRIATLEPPHTL